ncbi:hypothetical protein PZA11_007348 [Diplocarpon coronariae]|uniref:Dihydrofolate reductase n=1 Tax=Diplocarpon coronariae TaxID=2795749 RepID=A0A218ZA08_9HELO|nr:hypothetical protein JHW43_007367 [Diplocarpon mali]OWP04006.1 hypothetical protein B2J93_685 [Marssonina coronariae]
MPAPATVPATSPDREPSMRTPDLTLIVAATNTMGIGRAGTLPWTGLRKEMAYFARVTRRSEPGRPNAVLMGRRTWDSIPAPLRPLKGRTNVVVTRRDPDALPAGGERVVAGSLGQAVAAVTARPEPHSRLFVIGGAQLYKAALEAREARRILLTRVLDDLECDTFFPVALGEDGTADGWQRKSSADLDRWAGEKVPEGVQEENGIRYIFEMWERM